MIQTNDSTSWTSALITEVKTIQDAIANLNETGLQIVIVVSSDNTLLGTITDGDIRRGLLKGFDLLATVDKIMFRTPFLVPKDFGKDAILQIMRTNKIHQLPVVDENHRVIDLHIWDELMTPKAKPNLMVIMAGGKGTRLRPHTENCPKPMLLVDGKPMLEIIIERAIRDGFNHFIIAIHYLGHMIEEYFGDGSKWQVKIDYLREKSPLGTAGAISLMNKIPDSPFVVTNGDLISDVNYTELLEFHTHHKAAATMAVRLYEWEHPFGVVKISGVDIVGFEEKPVTRNHINAGIYVLSPPCLNVIKEGEFCDMPTLFEKLQSQGERTIVYPMHEPWLDVGRFDDLEKARSKES